MGNGKTDSSSISAYTEKKNENIFNLIFARDDPSKKHSLSFSTRHLCNTSKTIKWSKEKKMSLNNKKAEYEKIQKKINKLLKKLKKKNKKKDELFKGLDRTEKSYIIRKSSKIYITRTPETYSPSRERREFYKLVTQYEKDNDLKLHELSKTELINKLLDIIDKENAVLYLRCLTESFSWQYLHILPDIVIYLYKLFYPSVFDFTNKDENITFRNNYIENNFSHIFQEIIGIERAIIADAFLIALEKICTKNIDQMKKDNIKIPFFGTPADINNYIKNEIKNFKDNRIKILEQFIPSMIFLVKYYEASHPGCKEEIQTEKLFNLVLFSMPQNNSNALIEAYRQCKEILFPAQASDKSNQDLFKQWLNLYYINKKSALFDLNIIKNNANFKPHLIDGIVVKHFMNFMIINNSKLLKYEQIQLLGSEIAVKLEQESKNTLFSVCNNSNCIINNLTSRDYEMIDFIISRVAYSIYLYYLKTIKNNKEKEIAPKIICEIIEFLNRIDNLEILKKAISTPDINDIDNVDYDMIWKHREACKFYAQLLKNDFCNDKARMSSRP